MFTYLYNRYKNWIWLLLAVLFLSGAVSKWMKGSQWETVLNGSLGVCALLVFFYFIIRRPVARQETVERVPGTGRPVALFTLTGALAAVLMLPYELQTGLLDAASKAGSLPIAALAAITVAQTALYCLIASYFGLALAGKVGLGAPYISAWAYRKKMPKWSGRWLAVSVIVSFVGTLLTALLETAVFQPRLEMPPAPSVDVWSSVLVLFYGGIVEEVLVRLFLMTFIVWLLSVPLRRRGRPIPPFVYGIAIVAAALLFGLGHLPATAALFGGLNGLLVVRAIVLNGLLGIFFGYLYWRKGLEYAIVAHMSADLFLHVVWPRLFG